MKTKSEHEDGPRGRKPVRRHRTIRNIVEDIGDAGREMIHLLRRESRQERRSA